MTGEMPCRKRRLSSFQIIILGFAGAIALESSDINAA